MTQEYSKWPESEWAKEGAALSGAVCVGVDVGTTSTQAAVLSDGELVGWASIRTGADFAASAKAAAERASAPLGIRLLDLEAGRIGATGFGKRHAGFAGKLFDDVRSHGKGARHMYGPDVTTVVDLGAQTCRAIRLYDWDRVRDFAVSDICATGMGRNMEMVCDLLHVPITEIGWRSLELPETGDPEPVSTTCYNYASTETLGLYRPEYRAEPLTENEVYAAHVFAVAWRVLGTVGKLQPLEVGDVKVYEKLGFTGGLAKNPGVTKRIEREVGATALTSGIDPMLAGAIGSALLAME
jgi:benzoyl-CoA reductase subunit A